MNKAKVIITLQVLFLAVTIIFSTGIAYNGAGGQDTPPVGVATNLAIRQQGLEVADPAHNQFQAQLAGMDSMLRALEEVSQGRVPAGAQEMQGVPGAYLVPFIVDDAQQAAKESALVVMSRNEIPGLPKDDSLSALRQGVNVYLPAVSKASSAGQQTISLKSSAVVYGDNETMDRLLALPANADLSRQIRSLELLSVYDLADAVAIYSAGAKIRLFTRMLDSRLGSDDAWVLAQARVADEAGVVAERQLLMHKAENSRALTVYPVISTSPLAKTSSAGLVDVTVANRVFSVDTQAAVQLRAEHPILEEHLKHLGMLLSENMAIEAVNDGLTLLFSVNKEGLTPTLEWVGALELGITPEASFYTVNAQLGDETTQLLIKRTPLIEVMRANKGIPASTPGAFVIVNEKASSAGTNPAELLTPQLTNAQLDLQSAQAALEKARIRQNAANSAVIEADKAGTQDEILQVDLEKANAAVMANERALTEAQRALTTVQDAMTRLDSSSASVGKPSSAGIVIVNDLFPGLSSLSEDTAAKLLLGYPVAGIAVSNIDVAEENQAIIVYSDALKESPALQNIIKEAANDRRRFYLVNKEQGTAEEFLTGLGIDKGVFEAHVFNKGSLSAEQLALAIGAHIRAQKFGPSKFFISAEEDSMALERVREKGLEFLVMILKDKRFEIITDYTEQHAEYIRAHLQALIAA